ncbi:beta-glucosidase A-like isoform X2 [Thrips palmi]|uniref:Beta-glucosidase A-like isoform X2 n=1 Tax=Thrips palmi TaxID=161013 RepID=A0A6P8YUF1_THRPL|nr:beta-glucosidase A-like isoform X2 [Thrips palmi]
MGNIVADSTYEPHPAPGTMATDRDSVEADPKVLREAPLWIHRNYKMPIMITENGWAHQRGGTGDNDPRHDSPRAPYHSVYLQELLRVQREDGVDVLGYMVWSLLDSFEWSAGFSRKFGLVYVDYETGSLNRTLKDSSWFFQYMGENRKVPVLEFNFDFSSGATRTSALTFAVIAAATVLWWA